jgi:hypothetical protein
MPPINKLKEPVKYRPLYPLTRWGNIERKFNELGGVQFFGEVTSKEDIIWTFANGACICYNQELHDAFEIHGAIYAKWVSLGGLQFGVPSTDELPTPDGVGRYNHFSGGKSIYWTPQTGAAAIWGDIRKKWSMLGWERSYLGYPVTDELPTPDGVGRYNHFSNGGSIYWTPQTGANAVFGDIRKRWESLGWEQSYLGYPTSDEVDFAEGGRANEFQNGGIYWWGDTGAIDLRDVIVHYTGLNCFGETDWDQGSDSDEPYVIVSISTPQIADTKRTTIYQDVDAGEARPDLLEIYRGRPYGINISSVVMENDFGSPDAYKKEVQDVVMGVHTAGTIALGLIPIVGPAIAAVAGPSLGTLMPTIGGAVSDLFDWGDDRIGSSTMTLSAKRMVLLAARTNNSNFKGIGYKAESGLIAGSGASYKAYFGIIPA